ncbi:MAG: YlmC/YmxH family sporulation protein [Clostridiales bacterium]|nr:YlmC/YmxH family sporulation protein [Clostridiales bacterium]
METSFCELKSKCVINVCDGKNLGNITDIIIDINTGNVKGIVIPSSKNFFSFFKNNNNIFIPYNHIVKIGKDTILVDIIIHSQSIQNSNVNIQSTEDDTSTEN